MIIDSLVKKNLITIVPSNESYFHCINFKGDKRLTHESIIFNYQSLSPFQDSGISYIQSNNKIFLWFYDKKYKSLCTLPEGYLLYRFFMKENKNAIISIEVRSITVIKNQLLIYQSPTIAPLLREIELLKKKYDVENTVYKTEDWYIKNIKKINNQSLVPILSHFLDKKELIEILKNKFQKLIIPSLIFLIFLTVINYSVSLYLTKDLDRLTYEKLQMKEEAKQLFDKIAQNNKEISLIKKYFEKYDQKKLTILNNLASLIKKENLKLYHINYNRYSIVLQAETKVIENFLEKLSNLKAIDSYKLVRQVKRKDGKFEISISITLKNFRHNNE